MDLEIEVQGSTQLDCLFLSLYTTFDMNLSILFWNCHGVSSPAFRRVFVSLISV